MQRLLVLLLLLHFKIQVLGGLRLVAHMLDFDVFFPLLLLYLLHFGSLDFLGNRQEVVDLVRTDGP